jgi:hypothetical protein
MANNYNIPDQLEKMVRGRDKLCVYCRTELKDYSHTKGTPKDKATFEHIDNDGPPSEENIAMCCSACNASKGVKKLLSWFDSPYCKNRNIKKETVADIVQKYIIEKGGRG